MTRVSTNVRKKGRPPFLDDFGVQAFRSQFPEKNYRQLCDVKKYASVWSVFLGAVGEGGIEAMGVPAKRCRPKTVKRFPWLMGDKVQHVVISEMFGMPPEQIVRTADYIEQQHREKKINAKRARQIARNWKGAGFGLEEDR